MVVGSGIFRRDFAVRAKEHIAVHILHYEANPGIEAVLYQLRKFFYANQGEKAGA